MFRTDFVILTVSSINGSWSKCIAPETVQAAIAKYTPREIKSLRITFDVKPA